MHPSILGVAVFPDGGGTYSSAGTTNGGGLQHTSCTHWAMRGEGEPFIQKSTMACKTLLSTQHNQEVSRAVADGYHAHL